MNWQRRIGRILAVIGALALLVGIAGAAALWPIFQSGFSSRPEPSASEAMVARALRRASLPAAVRNLKNPVEATVAAVAAGRAHWADHCAQCHANDGSGDTEMGRGLYPRAPDLRGRRAQELSDGELYWAITNGIRLTGMPAWGEAGHDDEDTWRLVAFIRHLPGVTKEEVQAMEAMNPRSPMEMTEPDEEGHVVDRPDAGTPAGDTGH